MIREATESDTPFIQLIGKAQGLFNYGIYAYRKFAAWGLSFVMELANQIVGYVVAFPLPFNYGFCLQVGVASSHQNQGIGSKLITHAERFLIERYKTKLLFAHTLKEKSLAYFTKKLGYTPWLKLPGLTVIRKKLA